MSPNKLKNVKFFRRHVVLLATFFAWGCAQIVPPSGGARDTTPPKIVDAKSTPNYQTRFVKQRIELTFNEWIKLDDVGNQVVVSPPLSERPEITLHGKTVRFEFSEKEKLRENATYTVNFGNAIKDFTEGNVPPNLRFVFSTGDAIDSLQVSGRVVDAVSGQPVEGVLLMLYDNLSDTVVRKSRPFYFGKTDKSGLARISNVRAGTFKVFALLDKDFNYFFNQDVEKIGFPDSLLIVSAEKNAPLRDSAKMKLDSAKPPLSIRLFEPTKKMILSNRDADKYGVAKFQFNQSPDSVKLTYENVGQTAFTEISKDTLLLWYDLDKEIAWNAFLKTDTSRTDTVRIRTRGRADFLKKGKFALLNFLPNVRKHPIKPIIFSSLYPLQKIDNQKITLLDSSSQKIPLSIVIDSGNRRRLRLEANWLEDMTYTLDMQPGAITDLYGFASDTLKAKISLMKKTDFGDLILKINGLDTAMSYVCQIVSGSGTVEAEFFIDRKKQFERRVETLQPDQYFLKIVEDVNKNRRWDTGDYDKKRQPERIFSKQLEPLRANWELEVEFDIGK